MYGYGVEGMDVDRMSYEQHVGSALEAVREVPGVRKSIMDLPKRGVDVEVDLPAHRSGDGGEVVELAAFRKRQPERADRVA